MRDLPRQITAPLSRTKRKSYPIYSFGRRCAIVSAFLAAVIVAAITVVVLAISLSSTSSIKKGDADKSFLRHQSTTTTAEAAASLTKITDDVAPRGLIIHTHLGDIHIHFTPELSGASSIEYIVDVVRRSQSIAIEESMKGQRRRRVREVGYACSNCNFYRAETNLLLQGIIVDASAIPTRHVELGPCPDKNHVSKVQCPEHDPNCGCHGPIMSRGMVGWAGGKGGPDFFINTFVSSLQKMAIELSKQLCI
jgi:hypothetical protein